jgi:hypothetical protein
MRLAHYKEFQRKAIGLLVGGFDWRFALDQLQIAVDTHLAASFYIAVDTHLAASFYVAGYPSYVPLYVYIAHYAFTRIVRGQIQGSENPLKGLSVPIIVQYQLIHFSLKGLYRQIEIM